MQTEHRLFTDAKKLHDLGWPYRKIARELNTSPTTIRAVLIPGERERAIQSSIRYYKQYTKKGQKNPVQKVDRTSIQDKARQALKASRNSAKQHGYKACTATKEELIVSFTGRCHICDVNENQLSKRLHMDHCHETGKFRGWLCGNCNLGLGGLEKNLLQALNYLNKVKK